MKCHWDENKRLQNLVLHQFDFARIERFEWSTAILRPTYPSEHGNRRFKAIGFLEDNLVAGVFSGLGKEALSLISLRPASRLERRQYAEAKAYP